MSGVCLLRRDDPPFEEAALHLANGALFGVMVSSRLQLYATWCIGILGLMKLVATDTVIRLPGLQGTTRTLYEAAKLAEQYNELTWKGLLLSLAAECEVRTGNREAARHAVLQAGPHLAGYVGPDDRVEMRLEVHRKITLSEGRGPLRVPDYRVYLYRPGDLDVWP